MTNGETERKERSSGGLGPIGRPSPGEGVDEGAAQGDREEGRRGKVGRGEGQGAGKMKWKRWLEANSGVITLIVAAALYQRFTGRSDMEIWQLLALIGLLEIYRMVRKINGKLDDIVASNEAAK